MELFPRHRPVARRLLRLTPIALLLAWAGCAVEKDCGCEEGWVETSASPGHVSSEAVPAGSAVAPDEPADDSHPGATRFAPGAPRDARRGYVAVVEGREVPAPEIAMGDPETIRRILAEGKHRNRVMDHLTYLSAQIGPRLTGSSNAERANRWTAEQFHSWGLSNVHLDEWGTIPVRFDRGPSTGKALVKLEREQDGRQVTEYKPLRDLVFTTHAWAAGTQGPTRGPVVRLPQTEEELAALKDKLPGAWVLIRPAPMAQQSGMRAAGGMGPRYTHRAELRQKAAEPGFDPATLTIEDRVLLAGPAGYISTPRDDQDRVWTTSVPKWRELDPARIPTDIEVSVRLSDYDYLNSRLGDGEELYAEFDLPHTFTPGPIPVYNTVAEIPGTTWPDEVVIVSAHLDSWNGPGSMGTTDNGTGSSVTLEAARLLAVSGARPKRTIRFILWTGEEQGLLGSRSWVERHADELPRISAVFVDDGGTNYEGGLGCPDSMVEMLAAATAPVNNQFYSKADGKYLNVNIHSTGDRMPRSGGSDHVSFVQRGVPGFFWDEVGRAEYGYGWHTQHDRLDLAIPEYLRQSATCAAITAYNLACAESLLPRVPLPPPGEPGERRRGERRPDGGNAADGRPRGPAAPGAPPAPTPPGPAAIPGEPAPGQGAAPPAPAPAEPPAPASPARPEPEPK